MRVRLPRPAERSQAPPESAPRTVVEAAVATAAPVQLPLVQRHLPCRGDSRPSPQLPGRWWCSAAAGNFRGYVPQLHARRLVAGDGTVRRTLHTVAPASFRHRDFGPGRFSPRQQFPLSPLLSLEGLAALRAAKGKTPSFPLFPRSAKTDFNIRCAATCPATSA